jgi:hypothetical protein
VSCSWSGEGCLDLKTALSGESLLSLPAPQHGANCRRDYTSRLQTIYADKVHQPRVSDGDADELSGWTF